MRARGHVWFAAALALLLSAGPAWAQPDLDVAWWDLTPTSVAGYGSQIQIDFGVSNAWTSTAAGPFYIAFYYGDTSSTTNLSYLGQAYIAGLADGETFFFTTTVTMSADALYGNTRYLHYYIDHTNAVAESDETNNRGWKTIAITGRPDLQVTTLSVSPASAPAGGTLDVTYRIHNAGVSRAQGPFATRFYYSTNASINTGDTYLNQEVTVSSLPAQADYPAAANGTTTVTVPLSATTGTRYIGAIADHDDQIVESNENNNTNAASFNVVDPVDLSMSSWTTDVSSAPGYGSTVQISFQVTNGGTGSAGAFEVEFYYGDTTATTGLTSLGSTAVASLAGGTNTSTLTKTVTLPANVLYGTRYLHYFIDATGQVAESNESNNRDHRTLSITGQPDLHLSTLTVSPPTAAPGATLGVTYRIHNAGLSRVAVPFTTRFYDSADSAITTADTYLNNEITTTSLLAQAYDPATGNGTTTVTLPGSVTPGSRFIGAITDHSNLVAEGLETNNTLAAQIVVTGGNGAACVSAGQCASGYCVDGVCCDTACGGGVSDCQACSTAAGAATNGVCSFLPSSVVCRAVAGVCDVAESCSGSAVSCPPDQFLSATVCRPAAGICDVAESCSGSAAGCPADQFLPSTSVCRSASGECDIAESCSGSAAGCPTDLLKPNGTPCSGGICWGGACTLPPDGGLDLGLDAGPEAGTDAAADAIGAEAGTDGAVDTGAEASSELGAVEAGSDGTEDAPPPPPDPPPATNDGGDVRGFGGDGIPSPPSVSSCACRIGGTPARPLGLLLLALVLCGLLGRRRWR